MGRDSPESEPAESGGESKKRSRNEMDGRREGKLSDDDDRKNEDDRRNGKDDRKDDRIKREDDYDREAKKDSDDEDRKTSRRRMDEEDRREDGKRDTSRRDERRPPGSRADVSDAESSLRFLVPNSLAGSVIGKGGAVISEFQSQSGAKIVLSRTKEFFPGTLDRIILLNGSVNAILTALHLILSKLDEEERSKGSPKREGNRVLDLKIIVPNRVCGALIGKGGATVRSFGEDSGAQLKVSSQEGSLGPVGERMITIVGSLEQQLRAVALVLAKASDDPNYQQYAQVPLSSTASGDPALGPPRLPSNSYPPGRPAPYPPLPGLRGRSPPPLPPPALPSQVTTIIVAVPDDHVGAVVGKGGRSLQEISQRSGARIQVSDRGDFVEGTTNRKLTINGSADCVVAAQHLIAQKVQASIQSSEDRGGGGRSSQAVRDIMDPVPAYPPRGGGPRDGRHEDYRRDENRRDNYRREEYRRDEYRRDDYRRDDSRDGPREYEKGREWDERGRDDRSRARDHGTDYDRRGRERREY